MNYVHLHNIITIHQTILKFIFGDRAQEDKKFLDYIKIIKIRF